MSGPEAAPCVAVLIDENPLFIEGLAATASRIPGLRVVTIGRWADVGANTLDADLVVCDPSTDDKLRVDYLDSAKRQWPHARFLVITNHTDNEAIVSALSHGAHSVVFKSEPTETIKTSIELLCRGAVAFSLPAAVVAVSEKITAVDTQGAVVSLPFVGAKGLTAREVQTIQLVARGYTDPEIGDMLGISRRTVERHVINILNKLNCRTRSQAVAHTIGAAAPLARRAG